MNAKVYFVSAPGRVKIGFTCRPEKRLKDLQKGDMETLSVIAIIDGSRFLEKTLHHILQPHRLRGEWFADCAEVRAEIDSAIAGKYPLEKAIKVAAQVVDAEVYPQVEPEPSPEFQIVQNLGDEVEAALDRNADKYEVRGYANAFFVAMDAFLARRGMTRDKLREMQI